MLEGRLGPLSSAGEGLRRRQLCSGAHFLLDLCPPWSSEQKTTCLSAPDTWFSAGTILPGTTRYVLGIHCLEPFCSTSQNPVWICHPSSFRLCPDLTGVSWLVYLSPSVSVVVRWLFLIPLFSVWISQCLTESIWKKKLVLGFFSPALCQWTDEDILEKKKKWLRWCLKVNPCCGKSSRCCPEASEVGRLWGLECCISYLII